MPYDLSDKKYLLVKSNLNLKLLRETPDLHIQHQNNNSLLLYKGLCASSGLVIMLLVIIVYKQSMKKWETNIRENTLQEIRNK